MNVIYFRVTDNVQHLKYFYDFKDCMHRFSLLNSKSLSISIVQKDSASSSLPNQIPYQMKLAKEIFSWEMQIILMFAWRRRVLQINMHWTLWVASTTWILCQWKELVLSQNVIFLYWARDVAGVPWWLWAYSVRYISIHCEVKNMLSISVHN
jgi:hypothetical protein